MRRATMLGTVAIIVALVAGGCGGGGGGDGNGNGNGNGNGGAVIGPGPGAPAAAVPNEPGIDTQDTRDAPLADDPTANDVSNVSRSLLEGLADEENRDSAQDIQDALDTWATRLNVNRNDGAAQFGLGLLGALAGIYNTGVQLGYTQADLFDELDPTAIGTLALKDLLEVEKVIGAPVAAFFFRPDGVTPKDLLAKSDIPGTGDPLLTTEQVQIAIRNFALPLIEDAIARLNTLAVTAADPDTALITATIDDEEFGIYPSDIKALVAALRVLQANLLMLVAYDLNGGDYDWTLDWEDRDANGDGVLTVAEYAPADPFLWRQTAADNMPEAGDALRDACDDAIWAINNAPDEWFLDSASKLDDMTAQEALDYLNDLKTVLSGQVTVEVKYNSAGPGAPLQTANVPINLSTIWSNPVNDIKNLLPPLQLVEDPPGSGCYYAELDDDEDLPDRTFHGLFPDPDTVEDLFEGDYAYVTISYGHVEDLVIVDDV